ncbi:PhzF family phenazine biosynthesis protein [[Mycobacterium] holstebronense]|uniref:PhzF family phenazine biosynthesis protein n=1 Tax=[Mycobacterium] holstebronense TaxID=3064288 RepID=A0ABM9LBT5_9MYCO|nr:PhzF family phenazine biosynthesis protein [Mycolicibacter sp. MU0102]CAJ1496385.1 PhzF family phenazine biosynthesis protein [Mycolicibacter sp. MU0102]
MSVPAYVVDTFTTVRFRGNPTGVVLLDGPVDTTWMQEVAAEFNCPATAFVGPVKADAGPRALRWFSPVAELALCGSGTLASAHVLGGGQSFSVGERLLSCTTGSDGAISMEFPADPVFAESPTADLVAGLPGISIRSVWRGSMDVVVEAGSAAEVRALEPDTASLAKVEARAVVVTAAGDGGADIVSRVFAPRFGLSEDPVTGSAHCTLAALWGKRLGGVEFSAEQASARGGQLRVRRDGEHVILTGHAVTVLRGELRR